VEDAWGNTWHIATHLGPTAGNCKPIRRTIS